MRSLDKAMNQRHWLLCLTLLLCCSCACTAPAQERGSVPVLTLAGIGQGTAPLVGPWQFHPGDDLRWADPNLSDAGWEQIGVNQGWGAQGHFGLQGFAWYRRHFDLPGQVRPQDLGLYVPHVGDVYEVYWQGRRIGGAGRFPPHAWWPAAPHPEIVPLGPPASGVLAVRVWRAPLGSFDTGLSGGFEAPPVLGETHTLQLLLGNWAYHNLRDSQGAIWLTLLYGIVFFNSLGVWLQRRDQPLLLWLGLLALADVMHASWWHAVINLSSIGDALLATLLVQPLADISTWFVLLSLLQLRGDPGLMRWVRRLVVVELVFCACDAVALFFWSTGWPQWVDGLVSEIILLPELFPIALIGLALYRRKRLSIEIWFVAAFALLADLDQEVGAFLSQGNRFTHWTIWRYLLEPVFHLHGVPVSLPQVTDLLLLLSLVAAISRYALLENRRERARANEFHSAQELQRVLIPEELPYVLGYEVTSAYRPAQEVGGDFFQLIPQGGGSALLVVGDVSGKGLPAAMAVSLIVGTIRTLAEQLPSPSEMLAGINRRLTGKLHGGFVTCLVVFLDVDGSLLLASAGHPGPYLNGRELILSPALPLGLSLETEFEETSAMLQIGDHLTLFSDGLLEARSHAGELFGFDRIAAITKGCASASDLADAATAFGQEDDITVVTVTRLRVGAAPKTSLAAPVLLPRPSETA